MIDEKTKLVISVYLDGQADADEAAVAEKAIREDEACRKYFEELKKISASVKRWPDEEVSMDLKRKLEASKIKKTRLSGPSARIVPWRALAGVAAMTLAGRHPLWVGMAYLAAGAAVKWMAHQWEVTEPFRERLVIGIAQGGLRILLASTGPVTVGLIVMAGLQVGLTLLCLPPMRAFVDRLVVPRPS